MKLTLLCALLSSACVSRSEVGKEIAPTAQDAGVDASPDGASEASLSEEEEAVRGFERELIGSWRGVLNSTLGTFYPTFHFRMGSACTLCVRDGDCSSPSLYFVTDLASNGRFAGELQNSAMKRTAYMEDMWIEETSEGEVLRFTLYDDLFLSGTVELTRLVD